MSQSTLGATERNAPPDMLAPQKAQLAAALAETLRGRGLTQVQAAKICGTDQPTLSKVLNGRSDRVTIDKLMRWLAALGRPAELRLPDVAQPALGDTVAEGWPALADAIPCLLWVNRPDGALIYCNRRVAVLYGERFRRDRASRDQIVHPDDSSRFDELRKRSAAEDRDFEIDLRLEDAERGYRWYRLLVSKMRDAQGRDYAWAGAAIDIDEHKRTEDALRQSEERLVWRPRPSTAASLIMTRPRTRSLARRVISTSSARRRRASKAPRGPGTTASIRSISRPMTPRGGRCSRATQPSTRRSIASVTAMGTGSGSGIAPSRSATKTAGSHASSAA
jgi:PAS domain S-box-containing protein